MTDSRTSGIRPARSSPCTSTTPRGPRSAAAPRRSRRYFLKPSSSLAATGGTLERPAGTELLAFEGEIALVIGEPARRVTPERRLEPRGIRHRRQRLRRLRPARRRQGLERALEGRRRLHPARPGRDPRRRPRRPGACACAPGSTASSCRTTRPTTLLFPFGRLVADLSQLMTLETGDVILTGTPAGSSVVVPGDVVEVEVDAPDAPGRADAPAGSSRRHRRAPRRSATSARSPPSTTCSASRRGQRRRARRGRRRRTASAARRRTAAERRSPHSSSPTSCARCSARVAVATLSVAAAQARLPRHLHRGRARQPPRRPHRRHGQDAAVHPVPPRPVRRARRRLQRAEASRSTPSSPGEVLVIEARGERGTGTVGDVLALRAQVRGAAGIVTDGGVRDFDAVAGFDIPVVLAGRAPRACSAAGTCRGRSTSRSPAAARPCSRATSSWATATASS